MHLIIYFFEKSSISLLLPPQECNLCALNSHCIYTNLQKGDNCLSCPYDKYFENLIMLQKFGSCQKKVSNKKSLLQQFQEQCKDQNLKYQLIKNFYELCFSQDYLIYQQNLILKTKPSNCKHKLYVIFIDLKIYYICDLYLNTQENKQQIQKSSLIDYINSQYNEILKNYNDDSDIDNLDNDIDNEDTKNQMTQKQILLSQLNQIINNLNSISVSIHLLCNSSYQFALCTIKNNEIQIDTCFYGLFLNENQCYKKCYDNYDENCNRNDCIGYVQVYNKHMLENVYGECNEKCLGIPYQIQEQKICILFEITNKFGSIDDFQLD